LLPKLQNPRLNLFPLRLDRQDFVMIVYSEFIGLYRNKSSAVDEMGDRGHNRQDRKEAAAVTLSRSLVPV